MAKYRLIFKSESECSTFWRSSLLLWGSALVPIAQECQEEKRGFVEQRNLFKPIMYPRAKHKTSIAQFEWPSSDLFQQHMFLAKMN